MKLFTKCTNCNDEISFRAIASTRAEFVKNYDENKSLICENCQEENLCHVDKIIAKQSKMALIIAALILVVGTPLIFYFLTTTSEDSANYFIVFGALMVVPVIIYGLMNRLEQERVRDFNNHKYRSNQ